MPNWREIDRDPRWLAWLAGRHNFSGDVRQHLLNDRGEGRCRVRDAPLLRHQHFNAAAARGDAESVISFFNDFLKTRPAAPQPAGPAPTGKQIYTRGDILGLHEQHRRGAYAGREIEWMRIEHDIIAAGREGRIVGGIPLEKSRSGDSR